jgi:hypothetical protein
MTQLPPFVAVVSAKTATGITAQPAAISKKWEFLLTNFMVPP